MMKGYTTLEQSKKLVESGLDPFTADMLYYTLTPDIPISFADELIKQLNE